ncbi:MAG: hypothetical protein LEGION0403_FIIPPAGN_02212 [Legionella sp.]|uniref:hypothetical protein n=1 Tax=Legionella sp. TaxID=459 RepID=UPI003D146621
MGAELDPSSAARSGSASDAYYLYDENNRMTLKKGDLHHGEIVFGSNGSRLRYDNAGNVSDAECYEKGKLTDYHYYYDQANQLVQAYKYDKKIQAKLYDLAGRVTVEYAYDQKGYQSQTTLLTYKEGLLTHQSIRGYRGNELSYVNYTYDTVDNLTDMVLINNGGPQHEDGSKIAHKSEGPTHGRSIRHYDQNGLLNNVADP